MTTQSRKAWFLYVSALLLLGAVAVVDAPPARADLKISAEVRLDTLRGSSKWNATRTFTIWFQGDRARIDLPTGARIFLNGARNRAYVVDRAQLSFYECEIGRTRRSLSPASADFDLQPSTVQATSLVAGLPTTEYRFDYALQPSIDGDDPGRGAAVAGKIWSSPDLPMPTRSESVVAVLMQLLGAGDDLQFKLAERMISLNRFPLFSRITMQAASAGVAATRSTRYNVLSVSRADLPASAFELPSSLVEIDSPASAGSASSSNSPSQFRANRSQGATGAAGGDDRSGDEAGDGDGGGDPGPFGGPGDEGGGGPGGGPPGQPD